MRQLGIPVSSIRANSLAMFIVIALLGMIVAVLILPQVDLPDTAFQRNGSLRASRALSHQVPHTSATGASFSLPIQSKNVFFPPTQVQEARTWFSSDLPIQHQALRC
jgi:hypothetical protein